MAWLCKLVISQNTLWPAALTGMRHSILLISGRVRVKRCLMASNRTVFLDYSAPIKAKLSIPKAHVRCLCDITDEQFDDTVKVHLNEDDLEEKFVKGHGPGGQKVNKTSNCVFLRHIPTGILVKCHQSRYLTRNRSLAREIMAQRLDNLYNKENSLIEKSKQKVRKRQSNYDRVRKMKLKASLKGHTDDPSTS